MAIRIQSRLPNSVALRVFTRFPDEVDGRVARCVGGPVVLRPGDNEVDEEFWKAWSLQHGDTLLAQHLAVVADEKVLDPLPTEEELNPT